MFKERCPDCNGEALLSFGSKGDGKCNECEGTGIGSIIGSAMDFVTGWEEGKCSRCGGSGACPTCNGEGEI